MITIGKDVPELVYEEESKRGIRKAAVLIMDCGCMMNQETVVLDIQEETDVPEGYDFYTENNGVKFYVSPKVRKLADRGRIGVVTYGTGRYRRLEFFPEKDPSKEDFPASSV